MIPVGGGDGSMACLDTTVFLDLAGRGGRVRRGNAQSALSRVLSTGESLTTTRLNVAELYVGASRSLNSHVELDRIRRSLETVTVLEFDDPAALVFGEIVGDLLTRGTPIGDMDAMIAAVAIRNDQTMITRNLKHFRVVPGLRVIGY